MSYLGNSPGLVTQRLVNTFTATASQTTFTTTSTYVVGYVDVYVNGVKLNTADFVASSGSTVVLAEPCVSGDIVDILLYFPRALTDGYTKLEADTRFQPLDGPLVVSANTTSNALRITQTGSGNALLVEDSANPDATPFVVTAGGWLGIGTTSPATGFNYDAPSGDAYMLVRGDTAARIHIRRAGDNVNAPAFELYKARGTYTSPTIVSSGDRTADIRFQGYDGTQYLATSSIISEVDGTPGTNDMPGRLVFSTTADGASSPTERMRIDSAGNVGIGIPASPGVTLQVQKTLTGGVNSYNIYSAPTNASDVTNIEAAYLSVPSTGFAVSNVYGYWASQGTFTGAVTNQMGFHANSSLTGATNNFGFYSNIASGTGRWNFYANGTADNYFAGNVGIGTTSPSYKLDIYGGSLGTTAGNQIIAQQLRVVTNNDDKLEFSKIRISNGADWTTAGWRLQQKVDVTWHGYIQFNGNNNEGISFGTGSSTVSANSITERMRIDINGNVGIGTSSLTGWSLRVSKNITGGTSGFGVGSDGSIQSGVTSAARMFISQPSTAAASFTLPILDHYLAVQGTIGAGSSITNQYGFNASSNLTGATNNYGFYSDIASGTGRWNFYANGTANNYFAGNVLIGTTTNTNSSKMVVAGTVELTSGSIRFSDGTTQTTAASSAKNYWLYESTFLI